jgi:hypothetical protein
MIDFILSHKIIVVILAILVAIGVWVGLTGTSSTGSLLTSEIVDDSGPDKDLVATLLALRAVRLDASLFSDPAFVSLKDFSTEIVPEPVGRPNPFAPLGSGIAVSPDSTQSAQIFQSQ